MYADNEPEETIVTCGLHFTKDTRVEVTPHETVVPLVTIDIGRRLGTRVTLFMTDREEARKLLNAAHTALALLPDDAPVLPAPTGND